MQHFYICNIFLATQHVLPFPPKGGNEFHVEIKEIFSCLLLLNFFPLLPLQ
jgi:hypothetical protein